MPFHPGGTSRMRLTMRSCLAAVGESFVGLLMPPILAALLRGARGQPPKSHLHDLVTQYHNRTRFQRRRDAMGRGPYACGISPPERQPLRDRLLPRPCTNHGFSACTFPVPRDNWIENRVCWRRFCLRSGVPKGVATDAWRSRSASCRPPLRSLRLSGEPFLLPPLNFPAKRAGSESRKNYRD